MTLSFFYNSKMDVSKCPKYSQTYMNPLYFGYIHQQFNQMLEILRLLKCFSNFRIMLHSETFVSCIPSWNFWLIGRYCRLALLNANQSKALLKLSYGLPIGNFYIGLKNITYFMCFFMATSVRLWGWELKEASERSWIEPWRTSCILCVVSPSISQMTSSLVMWSLLIVRAVRDQFLQEWRFEW